MCWHLYKPLWRPVTFATIPRGLAWDYVEAPDANVAVRRGLPLSKHLFGIIKTNRLLTTEEQNDYGFEPYGG